MTAVDNVNLTRLFEPQARIVCVCGNLMKQVSCHRSGVHGGDIFYDSEHGRALVEHRCPRCNIAVAITVDV